MDSPSIQIWGMSVIRDRLAEALKLADDADDQSRKSTLRLICTALKDRDSAARAAGGEALDDQDVIDLLSKMVLQRQSSAATYEQDGRLELAQQENDEIAIISEFLPEKLDDASMRAACLKVVDEVEASGLRDVGRCMTVLKEKYEGKIDTIEASRVVKTLLTAEKAQTANG